MTCDCKNTLTAQLTERFKGAYPDATDHAVELQGYALLILDGTLVQRGRMGIHCTAFHPLKKGGTKQKTEKQSMIFTYCPFCGVKYDD